MNAQAQKQLKIGMRNNFNISSKHGEKADSTENESLHHLGNFYTDPRQVSPSDPRGLSRRVLTKLAANQKWPASILRTLRGADLFAD
jgi:hypothetical protein